MHKNTFGSRAPPVLAGEFITLPKLPSRCKEREGRKGKERVNSREGRKDRKEGCEGVWRKGKGRGRAGLTIVPHAPWEALPSPPAPPPARERPDQLPNFYHAVLTVGTYVQKAEKT